MDSIKLEQLITENMKSIFGFALTRLGNVAEAEWLASDILYEIIRSAPNLKNEERFYGFMWKIAENVYMDYLRKKSKDTNRTTELDENIADESESVLEEIVKKEELNLLPFFIFYSKRVVFNYFVFKYNWLNFFYLVRVKT